MKPNNKLILYIWVLLVVMGCEYDRGYDPVSVSPEGALRPEITAIEPDSAKNGILEIALKGENFSPEIGENFVYFGTVPGLVQTASDTQLTVIRPLTVSDSVMITVALTKASLPSEEFGPYWLEEGIVEVGNELGRVYSIALDSAENLYVHRKSDKIIYKITPDGTQSTYGTSGEATVSAAMRMGPDGYLYIQRAVVELDGSISGYNRLYRIAPGGGKAEQFVKFKKPVRVFDFDQNDNIFSGGTKSGLFVYHPDQDPAKVVNYTVGNYNDFDIRAVRVFEEHVYIAGKYTGTNTLFSPDTTTIIAVPGDIGIWKNEIFQNGDSLGTAEPVYNWANSGSFSASEINDITFSENGDIYVGTSNSDPILIIHSDGKTETLYKGFLESPATHLCWGQGNYLYVNRLGTADNVSGVNRVVMGKKGAPYYGRN